MIGRGARGRYEKKVARARASGDARALAHALRHLVEIHTGAGRHELADAFISEALELYRPMRDLPPLELANTLRPLALLREAQGRLDEARDAWEQARVLYEATGIEAGVAECDAHLRRPNEKRIEDA